MNLAAKQIVECWTLIMARLHAQSARSWKQYLAVLEQRLAAP